MSLDNFTQPQGFFMRALTYSDLNALGIKFNRRWLAVMEARGEFPRHFHVSPRRIVWDGAEVMAWLRARRDGVPTLTPYHDERVATGQWVRRKRDAAPRQPVDDMPIAGATARLQPGAVADRGNGRAQPVMPPMRPLVRRVAPPPVAAPIPRRVPRVAATPVTAPIHRRVARS